ncbi:MAG: thiamine phosphate synthase [Pelagibacterales bacterium]|nr:thiamine phosphate synthase [Pelagibacterales bacterium]
MEAIIEKFKKPKIYLISPNNFEFKTFKSDFLNIASSRMINFFQLRVKNSNDERLINLIYFFVPICKKFNIKFIINDRPDLAKSFNLDGVHVGKKDSSIFFCRSLLGKKKIVGKSCYSSTSLAFSAQKHGANYVAFGSFFQTKTKDNTNKVFFSSIHSWNKFKKIPSVGIGGISYRNLSSIRELNLDYIALSSSIWNNKLSPLISLKKIKNLIDNY